MSVTLHPSSSLGFHRPLSQGGKRTLKIYNPNDQPVAFKVKTTAPKLYCVRPNSGRVEPGEQIEVSVALQVLKDEPPLGSKCKDKFLIQSTVITLEKETLPLQDIWNVSEHGEETKVYQQKLKVVYLPPEGQSIPEQDEGAGQVEGEAEGPAPDPVERSPSHNGHAEPLPQYEPVPVPEGTPPRGESIPLVEPTTPPAQFIAARDTPHDEPELHVDHGLDLLGFASDVPPQPIPPIVPGVPNADVTPVEEMAPSPPAKPIPLPESVREPASAPATAAAAAPAAAPVPPVVEPKPQADMLLKYNEALEEIQRLRALLAAAPDPSSPGSTVGNELRRRSNRALSDDGSTIAPTEIGTMYGDDQILQPEGVPLQVVLIISLAVFITTYLFF